MSGTSTPANWVTRRTALRVVGSAAAGAAFLGEAARPRVVRARRADGLIESRAGQWKPWLLSAGNQFRPAPPPDAAATRQELQELTALAARRDGATFDQIAY